MLNRQMQGIEAAKTLLEELGDVSLTLELTNQGRTSIAIFEVTDEVIDKIDKLLKTDVCMNERDVMGYSISDFCIDDIDYRIHLKG